MKIRPNYVYDNGEWWYSPPSQANKRERAIIGKCACCEEEFAIRKARYKDGISCCSRQCQAERLRQEQPKRWGENNPAWKGYKDLPASLYSNMVRHARERGITWNLTIEEAHDQFELQGGKCALTGEPISLRAQDRGLGADSLDRAASLDRINNRLGYEVNNVHWVKQIVNYGKHELSVTEYVDLCQTIAEHNQLPKILLPVVVPVIEASKEEDLPLQVHIDDWSGIVVDDLTILGWTGEYSSSKRKENKIYACRCACNRIVSLRRRLITGKLQETSYKRKSKLACKVCTIATNWEKNHPNRYQSKQPHLQVYYRPEFEGYGDITAGWWRDLIRSAEKRSREFNIRPEYVQALYDAQNKKCALSGYDIVLSSNHEKSTASVDRIDNDKGYIEGNLQLVHLYVNRAKHTLSQEEYIRLCEKVTNYATSKKRYVHNLFYPLEKELIAV